MAMNCSVLYNYHVILLHRCKQGFKKVIQLYRKLLLLVALSSWTRSSLLTCEVYTPDPALGLALSSWQQGHDEPPPLPSVSHCQSAWDSPGIHATYDSVLDASPDPSSRARLLAVATKESGSWLIAPPISSVGLRMDDDVIRVAVGLRLGVALCEPHQCRHCQADVDCRSTHGLSCRFSMRRFARHAAINDIIKRSLDAVKIPNHLEPTGLYRSDG